jgi:hypothetical protein
MKGDLRNKSDRNLLEARIHAHSGQRARVVEVPELEEFGRVARRADEAGRLIRVPLSRSGQ